MKRLFFILFPIFFISCDISFWNIIGLDDPDIIRLDGIPVYFGGEFDALYYDYKNGQAIGILREREYIMDMWWNDSLLVVKNDTAKYYIINLLVPDTVKGPGWEKYGYWEEADYNKVKSKYNIDEKNMKHINLLPYWIWRKENRQIGNPYKWKGMENVGIENEF